jgi:hypothetical protein
VVTLPTIESSFVNHVGKGIKGFGHPDYPALRVAAEVLSATESFLWVSNRPSSVPYASQKHLPSGTSEALGWHMVPTSRSMSRLVGSCSHSTGYVLVSFDYGLLPDEPSPPQKKIGRVRTALRPLSKGQRLFVVWSMAQCVLHIKIRSPILNPWQIKLDETALDAAKSSTVYGVTKGVSTPERAVRGRFTRWFCHG